MTDFEIREVSTSDGLEPCTMEKCTGIGIPTVRHGVGEYSGTFCPVCRKVTSIGMVDKNGLPATDK